MKIILSKEAIQFDSPLFILKSFLAILTGYVLFHAHEIVGRDMISVLFGIMLSLEPVGVAGIKSGIGQIKATIIGGIITAIIIYFGGINTLTIPLSVAATIYITLLMDWKNISIIAIFTSIYMTQYVQLNALNEPSVILTFQLRMMAVFSGVFVAIFYNVVFSKLFYKGLVRKRSLYLTEKLLSHVEVLREKPSDIKALKKNITETFTDIDFVKKNIVDLKKEKKKSRYLDFMEGYLYSLRNINHYLMDTLLSSRVIRKETLDEVYVQLKSFVKALKEKDSTFLHPYEKEMISKIVDNGEYILMGLEKGFNELKGGLDAGFK